MIIYPKYKLGFDSNFTIFGEKFNTGVFIGNQDNFKRYEGLTLFNMDGQGPIAYLKYKFFKFEYHKIGDLLNYIGLNIDDADDYMLSAEDVKVFDKFY